MTDNLSNLFVALNKQAASRIAGVSRKNKRDDAKHAPATHSEIFDATFKNYAGRHDQQMHTTLFNLANPSQDRTGEGTRETFAKEGGSEAGFAALIATLNAKIDPITAKAWMEAHTASISAQQLWQQDISKMVVEISKEISAKGITAVEHGSNLWVLHNKLNYSTQPAGNLAAFGATASDQLANWNRAQAEIKAGLQAVTKLLKQFPDDASIKALHSQIQNRYVTFRATQLLMLRESWEHSDAANKYSQFASHAVLPGYTRTGLERINWDGATDAPASRDGVVAAKGIKEKRVAEGASTVREISRIAKEMGIPPEFLKFAASQTGVNRTTLAQYAPITNEITIFPHLVNGKTNTNVQLRAVMAHEVTHHQYEVISLAAKYSNAPTSPNSMQTAQVGVTFGSKVQKDLQTRDFIGTPYERKLLQALTNPKSVMNIDAKTGFVTSKRGFEPFVELFKADGVSAYSAKYWRDFSIYPSQQALRRAINETLSEAAYLRTVGQGKTIQKGWLEASQLFESLYGKLGSPYVGFDLDAGYKEFGSAKLVHYNKTQVFEALKEVSAKYTLPEPPKYTSKSMQKLVGNGALFATEYVIQSLKAKRSKEMSMIILGQTGDSLLVAEKGQDFNSGNAKGFYLDLSAEIAYDVGVAESYKFVPWQDADGTIKIPKWFNGKATPKPELSAQEMGLIRSYLEDGHIDLNELLRNNSTIEQEHIDIIDALDKALMIYGTRDYGDLYGAIPNLNVDALGLLDGVMFQDTGMQSAYDNPESALALLKKPDGSSHGTLIKYMTKEINLRNVIDMRFIGESNEFLFPRNTILTVVDVNRSEKGNHDIVTMDCSY